MGAPPRARWLSLGRLQRAMPGLLISSRRPALTPSPGPSVHGRLSDPCIEYYLSCELG